MPPIISPPLILMTSDCNEPFLTHYTDPELVQRLAELFGISRIHKLFAALRMVVSKYFFRLTTPLRSDSLQASRQLTYQTLLEKGWVATDHPALPEAFFVHTRGPFDLSSLKFQREVGVDKRAAESVFQGSDLFIPGVLSARGVKKGELVGIVSPQGDLVGVGRTTMSERQMHSHTQGVAVKVTKTVYETPSLRTTQCFEQGLVYPQSLPAILASRILTPDPNTEDLIVDLCAAPGGKTSHIAQLMDGKGKIIAVDNSRKRLHTLEQTLTRLRIRNVRTVYGDATKLVTQFSFRADKILLDPPCSALGVRPKLYEEKTLQDVKNLSKYQMLLIKAASKLLKKHGILVYSTCTLTPEENEMVVNFAIRELGMHIVEVDQTYSYGAPGFDLNHLEFSPEQVQRFYPDFHDTPGFFIAKLQKYPSR